MRWRGNRRSNNIEDRRSQRLGRMGAGGGGGLLRLLPLVFRFLGFKGTAIVAVGIIGYGLITGNLGSLLGGAPQSVGSAGIQTAPLAESAEEKELVEFVSVVLADTEDTWHSLFKQQGMRYQEPRLVLFRDRVQSACGMAESAIGPFYCPGDQQVYIDLGFYDDLRQRFRAPGDFAQAYVIAHEVGHHIQTLLGISPKMREAQRGLSQTEANKLSVLLELQADCLSGVWANHADRARQLLEQGDVEEGLRAASAIGDDALQRQATGQVRPDTFTHGSSAQRVQWFKAGLNSGEITACDTFREAGLHRLSLQQVLASAPVPVDTASDILAAAFKARRSDVQVQGEAEIVRLLSDDNEGSRHQRFIMRLANGQQILVAHNIDLAPRVPDLEVGERIAFYGEYEWNDKGGVIHWTHDDPRKRHPDGWLRYRGVTYQ